MQELKEANENYMRQLRKQSERAERNEFDQSTPGEQMNMDMADVQAMMDRIQELMEQGRMAEAQQALEELQQMMENLRLSENNQGGEGGQSSLKSWRIFYRINKICPTMRSMICKKSFQIEGPRRPRRTKRGK